MNRKLLLPVFFLAVVMIFTQGCAVKITGGTAHSDSDHGEPYVREAAAAIDDNLVTHWSPEDSSSTVKVSWIYVEWPESHKVTEVKLHVNIAEGQTEPDAEGRGKDYTIDSWDGTDWSAVVSDGLLEKTDSNKEHSFTDAVDTTRIRLRFTSTYGNEPVVNELECYESKILGLF